MGAASSAPAPTPTSETSLTAKSALEPKVIQGPKGDTGPMGLPGPAGPRGLPGTPGGPPGPAGPKGPQGLMGLTGPKGSIGPIGISGPAGPKGLTGAIGPTGLTGPIGPAGPIGVMGLTGPVGPKGDQGFLGPLGPAGPAGPVGPRGEIGPIGPIGLTGPTGLKGDQGIIGPIGLHGPPGEEGIPGPIGPIGPEGKIGPIGLTGLTGPIGPKGDQGLPGIQSKIFAKAPGYQNPAIQVGGDDMTIVDDNLYSLAFGKADGGTYMGMGVVPNARKTFPSTTGNVLATHIKREGEWGLYSEGWTPLMAVQGGTGNVKARGTVDAGSFSVSGKPVNSDFDAFTTIANTTFSAGWIINAGSAEWDPTIRGSANRVGFAYCDKDHETVSSDRTFDVVVPGSMKSGYLFHMPWPNCRYFDIFGVLGSGAEVFIKRVDNFQDVKATTNSGYNDAVSIVPIIGVNRFAKIRVKGGKGRIHYMGIGWTTNPILASGGNTGFIHWDNVVGHVDPRMNSVGRDSGDWFRIYGTPASGTALYNGLSVGADGGRGLSVGEWRTDVKAGDVRSTGTVYTNRVCSLDGRRCLNLNDGGVVINNYRGDKLRVQDDANVVMYRADGSARWASNTWY